MIRISNTLSPDVVQKVTTILLPGEDGVSPLTWCRRVHFPKPRVGLPWEEAWACWNLCRLKYLFCKCSRTSESVFQPTKPPMLYSLPTPSSPLHHTHTHHAPPPAGLGHEVYLSTVGHGCTNFSRAQADGATLFDASATAGGRGDGLGRQRSIALQTR